MECYVKKRKVERVMVRFLVFSDLHYDHIFDAEDRLDTLIDKSNDSSLHLDFVVSLGDLCCPVSENKRIVRKLYNMGIPFYYCVGNHDCENSNWQAIKNFAEIRKPYYSFIMDGIKFIVLNTCFMVHEQKVMLYQKDIFRKNTDLYPIIPQCEIEWLMEEMSQKDLKYVIFSHHSLANDFAFRGVVNREEIRSILEKNKTLLVMNGHDHGNDLKTINNIPYFTVNSTSYIWHGREIYAYSKDVHNQYPFLKNVILYRTPLYCIVEIEEANIKIRGTKSGYQFITPEDVGIVGRQWNGVSIEPEIIDWERISQ